MTRDKAWDLANRWIAAWNAHDLDLIVTHYEDAIELTSPVAAQAVRYARRQGGRKGKVESTLSARARSLSGPRFHLEDVLWGVNSVVLYYTNQKGTHSGEFMELSATGKVARVVAHYSA